MRCTRTTESNKLDSQNWTKRREKKTAAKQKHASNKIINDLHKRWNDTNADRNACLYTYIYIYIYIHICVVILLGCFCCCSYNTYRWCWCFCCCCRCRRFSSHLFCFLLFLSIFIVLGRNSIDSVVAAVAVVVVLHFHFVVYFSILLYFAYDCTGFYYFSLAARMNHNNVMRVCSALCCAVWSENGRDRACEGLFI